ncbi:MAG: hypothetical protein ACXACY_23560, partial [Candidatus Hodarchaeales archaeon]
MKIYYEPFPGFNKEYDFIFTDDAVMDLSFTEPEEPRLLREIGADYIVEGIMVGSGYYFTGLLMKQLIPEQIRVLWSHAYRVYYRPFNQFNPFTPHPRLPRFVDRFRNEVEQIAKQE